MAEGAKSNIVSDSKRGQPLDLDFQMTDPRAAPRGHVQVELVGPELVPAGLRELDLRDGIAQH